MKSLVALSFLIMSSSAFAGADFCRIQGTRNNVGVGANEEHGTFIYVEGEGYYHVTKIDGEVFYGNGISIDFKNRILVIDGVTKKLVSCRHSDSE